MQSEDTKQNSGDKTQEFVHLMSVSQMSIYAYIISIVGNAGDADDIMQETSLKMWAKYPEFKAGTDFVSWGIAIAYYKIKEFRRQNARIQFSDEAMEIFNEKAQREMDDINLYIEKLEHCLSKLSPADLALIRYRYEAGNTVKQISNRINKTARLVYLKLSKIHGMLSRCIKRLTVEDTI